MMDSAMLLLWVGLGMHASHAAGDLHDSFKEIAVAGVSMPVGIMIGGGEDQQLLQELFIIMCQEWLGYCAVHQKRYLNTDELFALLGCKVPLAASMVDKQCEDQDHAYHVHLGFATSLLVRPELGPALARELSYGYQEGMFVFSEAFQLAARDNASMLDFKSWINASLDPSFFNSIESIEPGSMAPCSSNQRLNEATHVQKFLAVTGDTDAIDSSTMTFQCWNDVFVLGPGCRDAVTKCVPYLTYASWMMQAAIQRIFVYKLSLAYGEWSSWSVYTQAPYNHRVVMYYWFPSYAFAELNPPMVTWMPYNASQWGNGIMTSEAATRMVGTYVSPVIREGYEDISDLASNMDLLPEQMRELLEGTKAWADSGMPIAEALTVAARSWLSKNTEVILAWLPNSTAANTTRLNITEESITLTCGSHVNGSSNRSYVFCPGRLAGEGVISTCGSIADTALQIHSKSGLIMSCDDCGRCGRQAEMKLNLEPDACYHVAISLREGVYHLWASCCSDEMCGGRGRAFHAVWGRGTEEEVCSCQCDWPYGGTFCGQCRDPLYVYVEGDCRRCLPWFPVELVALEGSWVAWSSEVAYPQCALQIEPVGCDGGTVDCTRHSNKTVDVSFRSCSSKWAHVDDKVVFGVEGASFFPGAVKCVPKSMCPHDIWLSSAPVPLIAVLVLEWSPLAAFALMYMLELFSKFATDATILISDAFDYSSEYTLSALKDSLPAIQSFVNDRLKSTRSSASCPFSVDLIGQRLQALPDTVEFIVLVGTLCGNFGYIDALQGRRSLLLGEAHFVPDAFIAFTQVSRGTQLNSMREATCNHVAAWLYQKGGCSSRPVRFYPTGARSFQRVQLAIIGLCKDMSLKACCFGSRCSMFVDSNRATCYTPLLEPGWYNVSIKSADGWSHQLDEQFHVLPPRFSAYVTWNRDHKVSKGVFFEHDRSVTIRHWRWSSICCEPVAIGQDLAVMGRISQPSCGWRRVALQLPDVLPAKPFQQPIRWIALRCHDEQLGFMLDGESCQMPGGSGWTDLAGRTSLRRDEMTWSLHQRLIALLKAAVDVQAARHGGLAAIRQALEAAGLRSFHGKERRDCLGGEVPDLAGRCYWAWGSAARDAGPHLISAGFHEVTTDWTLSNAVLGDVVVLPEFTTTVGTNGSFSCKEGFVAIKHSDFDERPWVSDMFYALNFSGSEIEAVGRPRLYRLRNAELPPEPEEEFYPLPIKHAVLREEERQEALRAWYGRQSRSVSDWANSEAFSAMKTRWPCPKILSPPGIAPWRPREFRVVGGRISSLEEIRCMQARINEYNLRCCYNGTLSTAGGTLVGGWPTRISRDHDSWDRTEDTDAEELMYKTYVAPATNTHTSSTVTPTFTSTTTSTTTGALIRFNGIASAISVRPGIVDVRWAPAQVLVSHESLEYFLLYAKGNDSLVVDVQNSSKTTTVLALGDVLNTSLQEEAGISLHILVLAAVQTDKEGGAGAHTHLSGNREVAHVVTALDPVAAVPLLWVDASETLVVLVAESNITLSGTAGTLPEVQPNTYLSGRSSDGEDFLVFIENMSTRQEGPTAIMTAVTRPAGPEEVYERYHVSAAFDLPPDISRNRRNRQLAPQQVHETASIPVVDEEVQLLAGKFSAKCEIQPHATSTFDVDIGITGIDYMLNLTMKVDMTCLVTFQALKATASDSESFTLAWIPLPGGFRLEPKISVHMVMMGEMAAGRMKITASSQRICVVRLSSNGWSYTQSDVKSDFDASPDAFSAKATMSFWVRAGVALKWAAWGAEAAVELGPRFEMDAVLPLNPFLMANAPLAGLHFRSFGVYFDVALKLYGQCSIKFPKWLSWLKLCEEPEVVLASLNFDPVPMLALPAAKILGSPSAEGQVALRSEEYPSDALVPADHFWLVESQSMKIVGGFQGSSLLLQGCDDKDEEAKVYYFRTILGFFSSMDARKIECDTTTTTTAWPEPEDTNQPFGPGRGWTQPRAAGGGFGDPHCLTYDGFHFECNFLGEALWTRCGSFQVHVIAAQLNEGSRATVLTHLAVKEGQEVAVAHLAASNGSSFEVYLDGEKGQLIGENISIEVEGESLWLETAQGHEVFVTFHPNHLSLQVRPAEDCFNITDGLLGNNNGDSSDDLRTATGQLIPTLAEPVEIFQKHVLSWCISSASNSLFALEDFQPCDHSFRPVFTSDLNMEACPATCAGKASCCLDWSESGEEFARTSLEDQQGIEEAQLVAVPFNATDPPIILLPSEVWVTESVEPILQMEVVVVAANSTSVAEVSCSICPGNVHGDEYDVNYDVTCEMSGRGKSMAKVAVIATTLPLETITCTAVDGLGSMSLAATSVLGIRTTTTSTMSTTAIKTSTSTSSSASLSEGSSQGIVEIPAVLVAIVAACLVVCGATAACCWWKVRAATGLTPAEGGVGELEAQEAQDTEVQMVAAEEAPGDAAEGGAVQINVELMPEAEVASLPSEEVTAIERAQPSTAQESGGRSAGKPRCIVAI